MVTPGHDQYDCPSQCQHQGRAARRNLNFKAPWNVRKSHAPLIARAARLLSPDFRRRLGPQASRASPRLGFIFCGANRSRPRTKEKPRCFAERGSSRLSQPSELDQR